MTGDALSCSVRFSHAVIFLMKVLKTLFAELKSNALICHVRIVLVNEIVGISAYLCSAGGKFCNNSTEFLVCVGNKISRFDVISYNAAR
jgi:hypothetical protein